MIGLFLVGICLVEHDLLVYFAPPDLGQAELLLLPVGEHLVVVFGLQPIHKILILVLTLLIRWN